MNKNTAIIIGLVIVAIIAGVAYGYMNKKSDMEMMTNESKSMEEMDTTMEEHEMMKDEMIKDEGMMGETMMDKGGAMMEPGVYEEYVPEKIMRAKAGDVVLFFHASWCPSCRGLNADIEKNLRAIPSDVSILKVNYDAESELKKKYGVTYQHTLVQVDASGALIKKWSGSPTLESLVAEIN